MYNKSELDVEDTEDYDYESGRSVLRLIFLNTALSLYDLIQTL